MNRPSTVSILIPLYNEEEFIETLLTRVLEAPLPTGMDRELIIVNDCSTDSSGAVVENFIATRGGNMRLFHHGHNQGKGAAIRSAIQYATGDYCLIQDADLEYDPREYPRLLMPLVDGRADAVFGSRFMVSGERRVLYFWHSVANQVLTLLCNIASDLNLTDMETCYKAFRTPLVKTIPIRSNRFGIEPEITIKLARRRARVYETPISYHGRTYEEGKKIGLKDAFDALWVIIKYRFSSDLYSDASTQIMDAFAYAPRFSKWMASLILPYLGERVLELGAGIGTLTRQLAPKRKYYAATDTDGERIEHLKRLFRYPHLHALLCDPEVPGDMRQFAGLIDSAVVFNVLEHVEDDVAVLRNVAAALPQGGCAVIFVPCGQEIFGTMDVVLEHKRRYEPAQLRRVCEDAGLEVEKVMEFNRISRIPWMINGQWLKRRTISTMTLRIFDRLVPLWRAIDGGLPMQPTSLIAVARRK